MKEIVLSGFVKTKSKWCGTDPWTIAFVYTPDGSFVVKGMLAAVKSHVDNHFPKYVANYTFWHKHSCKMRVGWGGALKTRGYWKCSRGLYIMERSSLDGHKKYEISVHDYAAGRDIHKITVRRVPRKWLDIYDKAC